MTPTITRLLTPAVLLAGILAPFTPPLPVAAAEPPGHEAHDTDAHADEERDDPLVIDAAERSTYGIRTARVARRMLYEEILVPGEVTYDLYRSAVVTPRIPVQVVERHARLGERVERGRPLVTLSSVEMAEAQGALITASREWERVRGLGREVVSAQRYLEARIAAEKALARVLAFGMTKEDAERLARGGDASRATGTFALRAPRSGTVVFDEFVLGEFVEPGRPLFRIADEARIWVEAKLSPEDAARIRTGAAARIERADGRRFPGRVVQLHHQIDEATRTLGVRIEVDNSDDALHAGEFVDVALRLDEERAVPAVPESALTLLKGSPTVFVLEGDRFRPVPVRTGRPQGGWVEIREGVEEGATIATSGVFLLKSLILKSEMGEGHGH